MNNTTYSYTANDFAGNIISREGLAFRQLATHVSNLVVSGYKMSIWADGTDATIPVEHVPPSWALKTMTDDEVEQTGTEVVAMVTAMKVYDETAVTA